MEYCKRCVLEQAEESRILKEIAHSRGRTIQDLLRRARQDTLRSIKERAKEYAKKRLQEREEQLREYEEKLKRHEEELSFQAIDSILEGEDIDETAERLAKDELREQLEQIIRSLTGRPEELSGEDIEHGLEDYIEQGYIELEKGRIRITPKGARRLASHVLRRILESLTRKETGPHPIEEVGYGTDLSVSSRKYEPGDEYTSVDIERTLLNSLERNPVSEERMSLEVEDFQVYEPVHETRICAGLIIDESGSMTGDKINAAIDTSLALSELIRKEPKDLLKVFLFSHEVKEIHYWDILNVSFSGGTTDIRAAMRAFRKAVRNEKGDKQAYLITDTAPNTEDGNYVGFDKAAAGVIEEALRYKQDGITLNIIMLDQTSYLRQLASILARKNAGRAFFTTPEKLGEAVIEDYLGAKKGS